MNRTAILLVAALALAPAAHAAQDHGHHGAAAPASAAGAKAAPASGAQSLPMTDAEVRKVDAKAGKVTVRHGRLENLDMAPMTMVFAVKDPAWLQSVKPGDKVRIAVDRVNGVLTIVKLEPAK